MANAPKKGHEIVPFAKEILAITDKDIPKIGYELFVRNYLPLLAAPPERDEHGQIIARDISSWLDIAVNPQNPVQVLNGDGTVRFIVPPLSAGVKSYHAQRGQSMYEIAEHGKGLRANSPIMAERWEAAALGNRLHTSTNIHKQYADMWNAILVEHGYPSLFGPVTPSGEISDPTAVDAAKTNIPEPTEDDFEDM